MLQGKPHYLGICCIPLIYSAYVLNSANIVALLGRSTISLEVTFFFIKHCCK